MGFRERYGQFALVVGASEGLGAEFARQLAGRGLDLILVARRLKPLEVLARDLRTRHGVDVRAFALDVGDADACARLVEKTRDLDVGLLVLNAALAPIGDFLAREAEEHARLIDVNCRAAAALCHHFGRRLVDRGRGGLLIVSSLAGLQGTATTAHYAASKAYLRVLGEGLWLELHPAGVDVLVCVAGPTDTPGWRASRPALLGGFLPRARRPEVVVRVGLRALGRQPVVIPGATEWLAASLLRHVVPARLAAWLVSSATRRLYATRRPRAAIEPRAARSGRRPHR
jgi:hypothetical protein